MRFVKVNSVTAVGELLTAKDYVHQAISTSVHESTLDRYLQDNDFNNYNLPNKYSITLNTQADIGTQVITKAYVDQFN